jgi:hypothetical protein
MRKNERIGFRVPKDTKSKITQIAAKEGRSIAQICEILLVAGITAYEKEGSKYLRRFVQQQEDRSQK